MNIGIGTGDLNAAAAAAAAAAARQAAIEAAERAAAEAAAKAAAEAAAKAAAEKAAQEAAAKAAAEAQAKAQAEQASNAAKEMATLNNKQNPSPQDEMRMMRLSSQVKPVSQDEAKQGLDNIQQGLKSAKTPDDVQKLSDQANELAGRASVSSGVDKGTQDSLSQVQSQLAKANSAVQNIESTKQGLSGSPTQSAATAASVLSHPDQFNQSLKDVQALKGSPIMDKLQNDANEVANKATPQAIADQLNAQPDIKQYPPDMAGNLVALRGLNDPKLNAAIDNSAQNLLSQPGGLKLSDVKANPALGQMLAPLQNSPDPAVRQQLTDAVKNMAKQDLEGRLQGKERKEGADKAMNEFSGDMVDLAKQTGLGPTIQQAAQQAAQEDKGKIDDVANKGKHWYEQVGDFLGNVVGDVGKLIGKGIDTVGDIAGEAVHLVGKAETAGAELLADGLDKMGAHGAANAIHSVDHAVQKGFDAVGDTAKEFAHGVGDAADGMGQGLKFMVQHPIEAAKGLGEMVIHPHLLVDAGKAMWNEAIKGGPAHAAGYIAGNIAPMLFGGGEASTAAKLAELASNSGISAVAKGGELLGRAADFGSRFVDATSSLNKLDIKGFTAAVKGEESGAKASLVARVASDPKAFVKTEFADAKAGLQSSLSSAREGLGSLASGEVRAGLNSLGSALGDAGRVGGRVLSDASNLVHGIDSFVETKVGKTLSDAAGLVGATKGQLAVAKEVLNADREVQKAL